MGNLFLRRLSGTIALGVVAACIVGSIPSLGAPISVLPADFPRPAKPPLGINLEFVLDYSKSMMFVDTMKACRKFGTPDAPWDNNAPVDADGWPTADAGTVVMADVPVAAGDYYFSCLGRCELGTPVTGSKIQHLVYDSAKNLTTAVVTILKPTDHLYLSFKNTQGGVKDIHLNRPGYPIASNQVFTREFLKALEPFTTLRLMDLARTNSTDVVNWADRPKPTNSTQASIRGVAWEYGIMLANQTGKDLWLNIPDQATDDYVKQMAQLFKDKLNKDRCVYFEYSNEVWNSMFPQNGHNIAAAEKEVAAGNNVLKDNDTSDNKWYWGWRRTAQRLIQISKIFHDVWGDDAVVGGVTRIRPVLSSQSANIFILKMQLDFIDKHFGPPSKFIYGIAGAPYIGPDAKLGDRDDMTLDQLFNNGFPDGLRGWVKEATMQYQTLAVYYRVRSLCYEGGLGLEGEHSIKIKVASNYDPRSEKVLEDYLNQWYSQGGDLFMYFNLCGTYTKFGCWGLTDDLHKMTPKMKGAITIAGEAMPTIAAGAAVPGKVMAAAFNLGVGGRLEPDTLGGKNLAGLRDGEFADYLLNVKQDGNYSVNLQTGTAEDGSHLELLLSGQSIGTVNCKKTGDWHKWAMNAPIIVHLQKGQLTLRIRVVGSSPNIRMVEFSKIGA